MKTGFPHTQYKETRKPANKTNQETQLEFFDFGKSMREKHKAAGAAKKETSTELNKEDTTTKYKNK